MTLTIFYFAHIAPHEHTCGQRVVRNLGMAFRDVGQVNVVPVRWCAEKRAIVHAEAHDALGFGGSSAGDGRDRAGEPISGANAHACLLIPEIPHLTSDAERFPAVPLCSVIGDAQMRGLRSAVIVQDVAPLTHPHVARPDPFEAAAIQGYGYALSYADTVFPVSAACEADLHAWWARSGVGQQAKCRVKAVRLPDELRDEPRQVARLSIDRTRDFVAAGDVGSGNNQIAAIRAFKMFAQRNPTVRSRLLVVGPVDPQVAGHASHETSTSEGRVVLLGQRSAAETARLIRQARATIFVPRTNGSVFPMTDSLWLGTPCICTETGSAAEAAVGGGCLTIDPTDEGGIAAAIARMATDDLLLDRLHAELDVREARTWGAYAADLVDASEAMPEAHFSMSAIATVPPKNVFEKSYRGTW